MATLSSKIAPSGVVTPNSNVTLGAVTATSFSGDGSGLTGLSAPSTSDVLSATAGASAGAVGTYAFLTYLNGGVSLSAGATVAGSSLYWSAATTDSSAVSYAGAQNATASGTWRLMGAVGYRYVNAAFSTYTTGNFTMQTVWLRIS